MIPLFKRIAGAFLYDELAARRWIRGLLLAFAAGGVAFADQLSALFGEAGGSGTVRAIKITALVAGFFGGSVTAGERNPTLPEPPAEQPK